MLSNKPYLTRAFYQWITDSGCTPIMVLDANNPRCKVPLDYAESGEIVFNVSPTAVRDLKINNDSVEFKASFSGVIHMISAPLHAILAIYAEENGEGLFFDANEEEVDNGAEPESMVQLQTIDGALSGSNEKSSPRDGVKKPFLKLVE